ncbi:Peptidase family M23 [Sulfurivirga caldicuralii]|uniref:Peptidase family M23 n=1 Tax=Sulfurivirga caldicuralii TaxID=364032 RepID=A0A1N6ES06_9GAMM|nr:peptidoglycan DD-metalloendopeptidase family protein [Sulfurivirga caldicuralii]SIN85777.1 Peptidase family M23 [Sulfurivirga caldicuralii]
MKNRFTITISDVHGVRHYTFNQLVKRFFWWVVMGLVILAAISLALIWGLRQEVQLLQQKRAEALARYEQLLEQRAGELSAYQAATQKLQQELDAKGQHLENLDAAVAALEAMLGAEPEDDTAPLAQRVENLKLTMGEKRYLLQVIPSGRPVQTFKGVSSSFGWRKHPVTSKREFHKGIDYRGKLGDKIIATADGVVEYAGYHKSSGYGNMVLIDHAFGFRTLYGHLKKVLVKNGQVVKKGDVIALMGNTGLSTGPHLHYEISFIQRSLNPAPFVAWDLKHYDAIFKKARHVPWDSLVERVKQYIQAVAPPSLPAMSTSRAN